MISSKISSSALFSNNKALLRSDLSRSGVSWLPFSILENFRVINIVYYPSYYYPSTSAYAFSFYYRSPSGIELSDSTSSRG
jgi:hypothetical protein